MLNHTEYRSSIKKLRNILSENPSLVSQYKKAKEVVRVFRKPAFYEITQRCNLWCEGCYYFEQDRVKTDETKSSDIWSNFFSAEEKRGVSMAYFVGAEPALEQDRLLAAANHFKYGNIGTNGTVRLDPEIPFRIGVSVWAGTEETDKTLRGGSAFRKALKNYQGDARAIMLFTVTRQNLEESSLVAQMCEDHGVELTFNLYSPTFQFQRKISEYQGNDKQFFRISSPGDTPCFSDDDLFRVRETLDDLIDKFPDTVIYSHAYNRWSTTPGPRYKIEPESGIASNCGSRIVPPMRYFTADLKPANVKCCTPSIDCSQCRMYSGGWSTLFEPSEAHLAGPKQFREWLDMIHVLGKIFVMPDNRSAF